MIFTERNITIRNDSATINAPVILYRGDKNVEVRFILIESPYKYSNRDSINIFESTDASYAQLVIKTPNDREPIFGDITAVGNNNVTFVIRHDMIDEIEEVGKYDFQIRLFDADQTSMATTPEVVGGFIIKEPIAKEDSNNNITNSAIVGSAVVTNDVEIPTFVGGSYNKTPWHDGDVISRQKLDKIEDGIYETYELSKDNSSQIKEKANESKVESLEKQLNGFVVEQSSGMTDTGSLELKQIRTNSFGKEFDTANNRIDLIEKACLVERTIESEYMNGFYIDNRYEYTPNVESKCFYIEEYSQVKIHVNQSQYYNRYTFLDKDNTIISYAQSDNNDYISEILDVPSNAYKLIISANASTIADAYVIGYISVKPILEEIIKENKNEVDKKMETLNNKSNKLLNTVNLKKIKHEQGGWNHDKNCLDVAFTDYNYLLYDIEKINDIHLKVKFAQYSDVYVLFDKDLNVLDRSNLGNPNTGTIYEDDIDVSNACYIGITTPKTEVENIIINSECNNMYNEINSPWKGKKIVWFGTSIPAGGYSGLDTTLQYPKLVGELLGAKVVNEAIGESAVHCKRPWAITEKNPKGFSNNWPVVSRCLSNSLDEMEWVIQNYADREIFSWNAVDSLSEEQKEAIRDCSWERKLKRHLGENRADLYVFDHGHNDEISDEQERYYTDETYGGEYSLYTYRGAMNFLINKIKEDNPFARIIIIGEYENQKQPKISEYQQIVAKDWSLPIYKQWEQLGWSQKKVKTTGFWLNGYWIPSGGTEHEMTYLDLWLPDTIHPHSDLSGKSIRFMAENIANYLNSIG